MKKIIEILINKKLILAICLILNLLIHLPFINLPPRSVHVWRQANTLAVARNFYQEDMDILNPRVDRRLDTDGVTGMQFPSYEFIVALAYQIFGEFNWVHRLISLLISSFGIIGMYLLTLKLFQSPIAAATAAISYCFSSELFYFGFTALPDILALSASVWGLYLFINWIENGKFNQFILSLFLITLAGLTKLQFLAVGFFIATYLMQNWKLIGKKWLLLIVYAFTSVGLTLAWYFRSIQLIKSSGLADFGLTFKPIANFQLGIQTIIKNLTSDLPELLLNFAAFALLLIGIFYFFKNKKWNSKWFLPLLVWSIALWAYHIIELGQMNVHSYYMMPYLPILFLIIAYASKELFKSQKLTTLLIILLFAQPLLASVRIIPARWTKADPGIPFELYENGSRIELINAIPKNSLCVVGPDISGCIYFYFLEKKGFGFDNTSDLLWMKNNNKTYLKDAIDRGAEYLISNDSSINNNQEILNYIDKEIKQVGSFRIYQLNKD